MNKIIGSFSLVVGFGLFGFAIALTEGVEFPQAKAQTAKSFGPVVLEEVTIVGEAEPMILPTEIAEPVTRAGAARRRAKAVEARRAPSESSSLELPGEFSTRAARNYRPNFEAPKESTRDAGFTTERVKRKKTLLRQPATFVFDEVIP
jgi:hypothetical protein